MPKIRLLGAVTHDDAFFPPLVFVNEFMASGGPISEIGAIFLGWWLKVE
jgi:hypothetical protein